MWRRVMGNDAPAIPTDFIEMTRDHVFGEVWSRPGLATRERRLISLTCTALAPGPALPVHVEAALKTGDLDVAAIEEWIIHLAHYAGWPVAANVYTVTREVLARYRE
jgi:4-carboxymuconolactone decarboxylase